MNWPSGKLPFECQKIAKTWYFFKKIDKNCHFFSTNFCQYFWKKMSSFWQFFDIQMSIFRRVRSVPVWLRRIFQFLAINRLPSTIYKMLFKLNGNVYFIDTDGISGLFGYLSNISSRIKFSTYECSIKIKMNYYLNYVPIFQIQTFPW